MRRLRTLKLILDECVNSYKEYHGSKNFERVVDVLGRGTKDPTILEYIRGTKMVMVTYDWELMLDCIKQGNDVAFGNACQKDSVLIKAVTEQSPRFNDPITYELLEKDEIIIP